MYYVMTKANATTVGMFPYEDLAEQYAKNFAEECIYVWATGFKSGKEHTNFFEKPLDIEYPHVI